MKKTSDETESDGSVGDETRINLSPKKSFVFKGSDRKLYKKSEKSDDTLVEDFEVEVLDPPKIKTETQNVYYKITKEESAFVSARTKVI